MIKLEIISLSGKAGSGKDFIFDTYLKPLGYHRFALADHFKIGAVGRGLATYDEVFKTKPPVVRKMLQQMGTEEGRNIYGEDVWLKTAHAWMEHISKTWDVTKFCITDCRFENEVKYIQNKMHGKVFRINAPIRVSQSSLTPEARLHISETSLDNFTTFDGIIENDPQFQSSIQDQINTLLKTSTDYPWNELPEDDQDIAIEGTFTLFDRTFQHMDEIFERMDKVFNTFRKKP